MRPPTRCFTPVCHDAKAYWRDHLAAVSVSDDAATERAVAHMAEAAAKREAQACS